MDYTQTIGNVNELRCILAMIELGYDCSIPYGNASKYDFIADINGKLLRFLCKSSHYIKSHGVKVKDAFLFNTTYLTTNTKKTKKYQYNSELIDYFITYFEGKVYVVPVLECNTSKTLRFSLPRNNIKKWSNAEDYLLEKHFSNNTYITSRAFHLNKNINTKILSYFCKNCGKPISSNKKLCHTCASINSRKVKRPEREELKNLIRILSFLQIGKIYKVSDNAVRKWCKSYNLPSKVKEIKKFSDEDWINI